MSDCYHLEDEWIRAQLRLHGITSADVARRAGCSVEEADETIYDGRFAEPVLEAIATLLGYASYLDLHWYAAVSGEVPV